MFFTLLVGISAVLFVTGLAVAYHRAPTRARCPKCDGATRTVVSPFWLRWTAPRLVMRWCPRCSWQGLGRAGPERIEGQKIAHDSGFHWGAERLPVDFGFVWRAPPDSARSPAPPDHPSGFRFGPTLGNAAVEWGDDERQPPPAVGKQGRTGPGG